MVCWVLPRDAMGYRIRKHKVEILLFVSIYAITGREEEGEKGGKRMGGGYIQKPYQGSVYEFSI